MAGGDLLAVKTARVLRQGGKNSWLEVVLDEGKNLAHSPAAGGPGNQGVSRLLRVRLARSSWFPGQGAIPHSLCREEVAALAA